MFLSLRHRGVITTPRSIDSLALQAPRTRSHVQTLLTPQTVKITINHTVDYMERGFMSFMRGHDITWAIGRVAHKTHKAPPYN